MSGATPGFCHSYAQLDQVGDRFPQDPDHLAQLGLVAEVVVSAQQAEQHADRLRLVREAGGLVSVTHEEI